MISLVLMRDGKPMRYFPIGAKARNTCALALVEDLFPETKLDAVPRARRASGTVIVDFGWWKSRRVEIDMDKQKLVVIGNGMAGARAVEEILARGGGDQFDITMFGDEPYGNYNRILLSNVLNGSQEESEIFINPLDWYEENNIPLHAGSRVTESTAPRAWCCRRPGSRALRQAADRHRQPRLHSADGRRQNGGRQLKPGVFGFRTLDDCPA